MPVFTVLAGAAEISGRVDAAAFKPEMQPGGKCRSAADVESSVTVEHGGIIAVELRALLANDEHGNLGSIFGWIEDLLYVIGAAVNRRVHFRPFRRFARSDFISVDRR